MPSPARGRGTRHRGSEEEFVLFLQGIPAHCRWQELKDMVRQTALHIRQAVVYDDQHGFPTGLGQIIVKNEDEAWRTYHRLSTTGWEGQSLVVTLARTSSPTRPIAGPTKSPRCVIPPSYVAGHTTPPRIAQNLAVPASPMSPERPVMSGSPTFQPSEYGPVLNPMGFAHPPFMPLFADALSQSMAGMPPSPAMRHSFCDPVTFTVFPPYHITPMLHPQGLPENQIRFGGGHSNHIGAPPVLPPKVMYPAYPVPPIYQGRPPTATSGPPGRYPGGGGRRTIFIQNISATTDTEDLGDFLREAGTIDQCEMPTDADSGRCKGFARVTFRHGEEAKRAVALFNNGFLKGAKIRVKMDRSLHLAHSFSHGSTRSDCSNASSASNSSNSSTVSSSTVHTNSPSTTETAIPAQDVIVPQDVAQDHNERPRSVPTPQKSTTDRCQPLVINGSGVGQRTVVT
ncbi:RNA-binding protein [Aspergillus candidus]|uniref:RRM domain-containing protein n=1 Tax=Aspergillus candidus TaxID=41067 RepID=A0A2I2FLH2_ASPCN|nr:hypothetical protein BDW47DRAFT_55467 [Aspergillus candidus]PLB41472.1 hypothetical protein BDW47DRAFT_55467 [Aspergillus candidus]